jgi:3-O-methylgallate 3,4-dioxygenase
MATITLGVGSSHTPMLSMTAGSWERWGRRDAAKTDLVDLAGDPVTYDELVARAAGRYDAELTLEVFESKIKRCQLALDELARRIADARLDAMIVVGDDQYEHFDAANMPSILLYHGATIPNTRAEVPEGAPQEIAELTLGYYEPVGDVDYPVDVELAHHLVGHLLDGGFDLATSERLPKPRAEGHALQFPHRRLLGRDLPVVPILLNTYMPPSQPRAARCYRLGVALAAAVRDLPGNARVGVLGSGGVSHFVVMEDFDRPVLDAFARHDQRFLSAIPECQLQSGTSETKNWIVTAGACAGLGFELLDYVPGYRTPAGTGTGMAFATWS